MMNKTQIILISLLIHHAASAFVSNYGSTIGVDTKTFGTMRNNQLHINTYDRTHRSETVNMRPDGLGGYESMNMQYDPQTKEMYKYNVDRFGNTTRTSF